MTKQFLLLLGVLFVFKTISIAQDELIDSKEQLKKGMSFYSSKDYKSALEAFNKVSRNDTNYAVVLTEIAVAYYQDEQFQKSYEASILGLALSSGYDHAYYNTAGLALKGLKKYKESEDLFKKAIEKYPNEYLLYFNLGILHEEMHKTDLSIKDYQNSILVNPRYAPAHSRLGRIYLANHKPVQGMMAMEMALYIDPDNSNALSILQKLEEAVNELTPETADSDKVVLPQDNFGEVEQLIKAKVALNNTYKNKTKLNYVLAKQTQLLLEKLSYYPADKDFFMQVYAPFFTELAKNNYLEPLVYVLYANVNDPNIQAVVKKNLPKIKTFYTWGNAYLDKDRKYRASLNDDPSKKQVRFFYTNNRIEAKGQYKDAAETIKSGEWVYYHTNGTVSDIQRFDDEGKLNGEWITYYNTGVIKTKSNFKNGKRDGPSQSFYKNGVLEWEYPSIESKAQGDFKAYYPSGQLKKLVKYVNDEENGLSITYYDFGGKESEINFVNSKKEGEYKEFYKTGEVLEVSQFKNNLLEGVAKTYHANGKLKTEGTAKAGTFVGEWKEYYENGNTKRLIVFDDLGVMKSKKVYYKDGKIVQLDWAVNEKDPKKTIENEYFESGKLYSVFNYAGDVIKDYKIYDQAGAVIAEGKENKGVIKIINKDKEGNLLSSGDFVKGLQSGEWLYYDNNGSVKTKTNYKDGKENGPAYDYYANGALFKEYSYKDGELDGFAKFYHKNKTISSKGWYVAGQRQGDWYEYYANGNLESKYYYLNDVPYGYRENYTADGKKSYDELYEFDMFSKGLYYDTSGTKFYEFSLKNGTGEYLPKYPNGQVKIKGKYVNGNAEGEYLWYHGNGTLLSKGNYLHDNRDGKYVNYYDNGKLSSEGFYKNGQYSGAWKWVDEKGIVSKTGWYKGGDYDSLWTYYSDLGKKDYVANYKEGERDGYAYYYTRNGESQLRKTFKDGKFIAYSAPGKDGSFLPEVAVKNETATILVNYPNGHKAVEETIEKGMYEGKRVFYYSNGQKEYEVVFKAHMKEGEQIDYYSDGKVRSKTTYFYDELDGKAQYFRENGKKEKEGKYLLGSKHGAWKYYDENGKEVKTVVYWHDEPISEVKNGKLYAEN